MSNHTKEHWKWDGVDREQIIATEADKRLITAAPELLEACVEIQALMSESQGIAGFHLNGDVATWDYLDLRINSAITKATGEEES